MRIPLIILLLFLFTKAFPHQDKFYKYKYDNVTVIIKTGYKCEEINNVKIIGQYASILCKEFQFNNDVFLYFDHDYMPENDILNPTFLSFRDDYIYKIVGLKINDLVKSDSVYMNNKAKIVIQQYGFHYSIKETLQLIEFGVQKLDFIKNYQKVFEGIFSYKIESIDYSIIDSIKKQHSTFVQDILKNKVYISPSTELEDRDGLNVSYFSQNGKYILFDNNEKIIDTLNQIIVLKYTSDLIDYVVVLESSKVLKVYSKRWIDNKDYLKSIVHDPKIVRFDHGISDARLLILDLNSLLIEFCDFLSVYNDMKLIYLREEDILITDLMEFIDSHYLKK